MQALSTATDLVPEGALLAQPVLDSHGQLLLPASVPVTRSTLQSLERRGIATVFVNLPEAPPSLENSSMDLAEHRAQAEKRLQHLFRPAMRAGQLNPLFHLILRYRCAEKP